MNIDDEIYFRSQMPDELERRKKRQADIDSEKSRLEAKVESLKTLSGSAIYQIHQALQDQGVNARIQRVILVTSELERQLEELRK